MGLDPMTDEEIRKIIALKVADGSLPRDLVQFVGAPGKNREVSPSVAGIIGAKPDPGLFCVACDENKTDLAMMKAEKSFPFHARCLYLYQDEMGRAG